MTSMAEDVLYAALTDTDDLEALATIGLDLEAIPTAEMREVVSWAIDRFFESGRTVAPSRVALVETWGQHIEDAGVELLPEDEDRDTIQWAIDALKAKFVEWRFQGFTKDAAMDMATAAAPEKVKTLAAKADELFTLSMRVQPRHMKTDAATGFEQSFADYQGRAREGHTFKGMTFGLPAVDNHTFGIHPGELAVLAAGPKTGKSMFVVHAARTCWQRGETTVLFTLENSVQMTIDRLVCQILSVDYRNWQRGQCQPEEEDRVRGYINDELPKFTERFHIIMPEPGKRTPQSLVREAQMLGAKHLFIDQLTFLEHPSPARKARHEIIRDLMHDLKTLISSGNQPIPCLLAHQINREGVKAARNAGYLLMENMAEGSEVERTADWVFGLLQTEAYRIAGQALLQVLAARREDITAWDLNWVPARGGIGVIRETEVGA